MMNDCRLLDGMAAIRRSLKYSSESVFDGQSERTKSRAGRWDSLFRIRLFHPHGAHPSPPPRNPVGSQPVRWIAKRERGKGQKGEGEEEKGSIVSFNDNRRGRRTFDRINRLISMVLLNTAGTREKR